jgi:hypothetical protein
MGLRFASFLIPSYLNPTLKFNHGSIPRPTITHSYAISPIMANVVLRMRMGKTFHNDSPMTGQGLHQLTVQRDTPYRKVGKCRV